MGESERICAEQASVKKILKVVADMRNVTLGNAVPYTLECTSSALTKANWECEPASLKIKIENVVQESFGVEVDTTGEPVDGYDIGTSTIKEGDTINIAGAESLMNIIQQSQYVGERERTFFG